MPSLFHRVALRVQRQLGVGRCLRGGFGRCLRFTGSLLCGAVGQLLVVPLAPVAAVILTGHLLGILLLSLRHCGLGILQADHRA